MRGGACFRVSRSENRVRTDRAPMHGWTAQRERGVCVCGRVSRTFTDRQKDARQRAYMRLSASVRARGERLGTSLPCLCRSLSLSLHA